MSYHRINVEHDRIMLDKDPTHVEYDANVKFTSNATAEKGMKDVYDSSKTYPYFRGLAGPEIVNLGGPKRPPPTQNPLEKVGGFAPHLFRWVLR